MKLTPRTMFRFEAPKQGGKMVYPYSWSAKIAHFNFKYEWKMSWTFRYGIYGMMVVFPMVWYLDSCINSPAAKSAYLKAKKAQKEKEHAEHKWADIQGRYANR